MIGDKFLSIKNNLLWRDVVLKSIDKTVAGLIKITPSRWSVACSNLNWHPAGGLAKLYKGGRETAAGVFFDVAGDIPITVVLSFSADDIGTISRSFVGQSYAKLNRLNHVEELVIAEFGNIIVNSFIGALANMLNTVLMPSAPRCLQGTKPDLIDVLLTTMPVKFEEIFTAELKFNCEEGHACGEFFAFFPEEALTALDKILNKKA